MTAPLTDRDMLVRTMSMFENAGDCCSFFACPGRNARPVPMASCSEATAAYELRNYLQRHGGWCPEHGQNLDECHPPAERPDALGYARVHRYRVCTCAPVVRNSRGKRTDEPSHSGS